MNKPGQGMILKEKAKNINSNLYQDLMNYSNLELKKNPKNIIMLISKCYALIVVYIKTEINDEKRYQQAVEQCEKALKEEPLHLHALYRKSYSLRVKINLLSYKT